MVCKNKGRLPVGGLNPGLSVKRYKVVSESFWDVIVVTASVKEEERGGRGHISASLLH
jgi:hypothetical protein